MVGYSKVSTLLGSRVTCGCGFAIVVQTFERVVVRTTVRTGIVQIVLDAVC